MFKRLTWLSVGLVAGFGASKWVERKARRHLARYLPAAQLGAGLEAAGKAREVAANKVSDIRSALEGGRDAMAAREAELRRRFQQGPARPEPVPADLAGRPRPQAAGGRSAPPAAGATGGRRNFGG